MISYGNKGGDSGILGYEIQEESIIIYFPKSVKYLYTYDSAGAYNIEEMKSLPLRGEGLNAFINRNVKTKYHSKI